jgi:hypothetical protein
MSTTIDSKVVEMKFDNDDFEANVKNSMSTLDKLKEKLNFKGATKGLSSIQKASDNLDFSGMSSGLDGATVKFSALQVAGMTAISNITTSLMGLASNLLYTFAIEPRSDGLQEYELKMGSIQTIMASTGESIEVVNDYLNELNTYSDKTIYSFSDMTNNIGKFTNAGVDLKTAVAAIQGVSNEAALAGANTNEASRAMYNFAQALSAGYVKLIDWKSIENANMATVSFKQELIDTAASLGTLEKQADGTYKVITTNANGSAMDDTISATKNFNDSLSYQWMTTDVLVQTLARYSDETTTVGKKAFKAATEVKTFSMMMDTLKETAGSGWAMTFEKLVGNFTQGVDFWTVLTNSFSGVIDSISDARNNFLTDTLTSSWDQLSEQILNAGFTLDEFQEKLKATAGDAVDIDAVVEEAGSLTEAFNDGKISADILRQTLINLGDESNKTGVTQEQLDSKLKTFTDTAQKFADAAGDGAKQMDILNDEGYNLVDVQDLMNKAVSEGGLTLSDLSDAQLTAIGYSDDEILALRNLSSQAQDTNSSLSKLIDGVGQMSGRDYFTGAITNTVQALVNLFYRVKQAWGEIFTGESGIATTKSALQGIYNVTNKFLTWTIERGDVLKRSLKGIFAVLKIVSTFVGGPIKVAIKLVCKLLNLASIDILDVTAAVGDALVAFEEWITSNKVLQTILGAIATAVLWVADKLLELKNTIAGFVSSLKIVERLKTVAESFKPVLTTLKDLVSKVADGSLDLWEAAKKAVSTFGEWFDTADPLNTLFGDLTAAISDFLEPVKEFVEQNVPLEDIAASFERMKDAIKDFAANWLGIGDTSGKKQTVREAVQDIYNDAKDYLLSLPPLDFSTILQNGIDSLLDVKDRFLSTMSGLRTEVESMGGGLFDFLSSINWDSLIAAGGAAAGFYALKQLSDSLTNVSKSITNITNPFSTFSGLVGAITKVVPEAGKALKSVKWVTIGAAVLNFALAIGVLAIALRLIGDMEVEDLNKALGALLLLIGSLGAVAIVISSVSKLNVSANLAALAAMFIALGVTVIAIAAAVAIMANLDNDSAKNAVTNLGTLLAEMTTCIGLLIIVSSKMGGANLTGIGTMFVALGVSLVLMAAAIAIIGSLDKAACEQGTEVVRGFLTFVTVLAIVAAACPAGQATQLGVMALALSASLLLLAAAIAIIGSLDGSTLAQGVTVTVALGIFLGALVAVIAANAPGIAIASAGIIAIVVAIGLMVVVSKLAAKLSEKDFEAGAKAIAVFGTMIVGLLAIMKVANIGDVTASAATILAMSIAIAALVAVAILCGMVQTEQLFKGVVAVGALGLVFAAIMKACNGIQEGALKDASKTIVMMAAVIAAMTACAIILGMMDTDKCIQGVAAVSVLGLVFAGLMVAVSKLNGIDFKSAAKTIALGIVVMAAMTAFVYVLAQIDCTNALPNAVAIAVLMTAMVVALKVVSTIKGDCTTAVASLAMMSAVCILLAAVVAILASFDTNDALVNTLAVSVLLLAMSASLKIISGVNSDVIVAVGVLAIMAVVVKCLADVVEQLASFETGDALPNVLVLSTLLIAMSVCLGLLTTLNVNVAAAADAALSLAAFIGILIAFVAAVGQLSSAIEGTQEFIATGGAVLIQLADILGQVIGTFVGSLIESLSDSLPGIATNISLFCANLMPGAIMLSQMSGMDFSGVASLATALLEITAVELLDGLTNLLGIKSDIKSRMVEFGEAIAAFAGTLDGVDVDAVNTAAQVAQPIADMMSAFPNEGGLASTIFGSESEAIKNMANTLPTFGTAIASFTESISGMDENADIDAAVSAAKKVCEILQLDLPTEGGLAGMVFGSTNDSLSKFAANMKPLGEGVAAFAEAASGVSYDGLDSAISTIKTIAKLMTGTEGVDFNAIADITTAGLKTKFDNLGIAAFNFASHITGCDFSGTSNAVAALKDITGFIKNELSNYTSGDNNAQKLVDDINTLGNANAQKIVTAFQGVSTNLLQTGSQMMQSLASGISVGMVSVTLQVSTCVISLASAFTKGNAAFTNAGNQMMSNVGSGITTGTTKPKAAATAAASAIGTAFTSKKSIFTSAGRSLMGYLANGISAGASTASTAAKNSLSGVASALRSYHSGFYSAGQYCATGLAQGILSGNSAVKAAATKIATNAVEAAKKAADVNSPSKKFIAIGKWCAVGFANGMNDNAALAGEAGANLSETVMSAASDSLSLLDAMANTKYGFASLTPVIDQNGLNKFTGSIDLSSQLGSVLSEPIKSNAELFEETQKALDASNSRVLTALNSLNGNLDTYAEAIANSETAMYVDGKKLASSIAKPMNRQLGLLSKRGGLA